MACLITFVVICFIVVLIILYLGVGGVWWYWCFGYGLFALFGLFRFMVWLFAIVYNLECLVMFEILVGCDVLFIV